MKLTDIAPLERWKELEMDIHRRSGLNASVFNPEGFRISDYKAWANRLCPEIKATDKGQSFICAPAHMNIAAQARNNRRTVIEECDAGLIKLVVPIFFDGAFLGAVSACGVLLDDGEVDGFLVNKMTDIEQSTVERLSEGIPSITTEAAEALGRYIEEQVDRIIEQKQP
jgi:ligand-binding sensor protein